MRNSVGIGQCSVKNAIGYLKTETIDVGAIPATGSKNMKNKTKKLKRKTVSENSRHSNFYTSLNLYTDINGFSNVGKGYMCYLPNGTMYRKMGVRPQE